MGHVAILTHREHTIVQTVFPRGADLVAIREILGDAGCVYAQMPHGQVLALVDFDGQELDQSAVNLIEAVAKANAETVMATALMGVNPKQRSQYENLGRLMRRNARIFENRAAALDWLVAEAEGLAWLTRDEGTGA